MRRGEKPVKTNPIFWERPYSNISKMVLDLLVAATIARTPES
jgi:hypothetical protein